MYKRIISVSAAALLVIGLASCASTSETNGSEDSVKDLPHVSLITSFHFDAGNTGYAVAVDQGFYKDAGVDAEIIQGTGSNAALQRLLTGEVDFAMMDPALMVRALDEDPTSDLVAVANIQQETMYSALYVKGKKIKSVEDLANPNIIFGDTGGSAATLYPTFVRTALNLTPDTPVNTTQMDASTRIGGLVNGTVDIVASVVVETPQVMAVAKDAGIEFGVFKYAEYGFNPYGYALVTTRAFVKSNPEVVRAVVEGSIRGWQWTAENLDEATKIVQPLFGETPLDISRAEVAIAVNLVVGGNAASKGIGDMDLDTWNRTLQLAETGFGIKPGSVNVNDLFDSSFIPATPVTAPLLN